MWILSFLASPSLFSAGSSQLPSWPQRKSVSQKAGVGIWGGGGKIKIHPMGNLQLLFKDARLGIKPQGKVTTQAVFTNFYCSRKTQLNDQIRPNVNTLSWVSFCNLCSVREKTKQFAFSFSFGTRPVYKAELKAHVISCFLFPFSPPSASPSPDHNSSHVFSGSPFVLLQ